MRSVVGMVSFGVWCLVCGVTVEKSCRKFKSCLALIQHSLAIHKTNLKSQHRAFDRVVCNVLGWDVNNHVASSQKDSQNYALKIIPETNESWAKLVKRSFSLGDLSLY